MSRRTLCILRDSTRCCALLMLLCSRSSCSWPDRSSRWRDALSILSLANSASSRWILCCGRTRLGFRTPPLGPGGSSTPPEPEAAPAPRRRDPTLAVVVGVDPSLRALCPDPASGGLRPVPGGPPGSRAEASPRLPGLGPDSGLRTLGGICRLPSGWRALPSESGAGASRPRRYVSDGAPPARCILSDSCSTHPAALPGSGRHASCTEVMVSKGSRRPCSHLVSPR
mmetsp:Transcript_19305/g.46021  ORF Transcript_19305/g.46021 Transcript_19305/m.46021 type:complete len:226 (+) Transcript_19305:322-999(+)